MFNRMVRPADIFTPTKQIIQIAGVIDEREARMLSDCGADLIGFPFQEPRGADDLPEKTAGEIIRSLPLANHGVLITYLDNAQAILMLSEVLSAPVVQLHGGVAVDELRLLRRLSPDLVIIKALIVKRGGLPSLIEEVDRYGAYVDAFLTDTFDEGTGRWGATGKTHDWTISRRLVEHSARPVILAGGLSPDNVRSAVLEVRPAGVDTHTGVEDADGRKSQRLVEKFISEARDAHLSM